MDSIAGCKSYVHGAQPRWEGFETSDAEARFVAALVKGWLAKGIAPSEIGIATRTRWFGSKIEDVLHAEGIPTVGLASASINDEAVHVGTMHRMRGLEFRCVAVAGVGAKLVPEQNAVTPVDQDQH